jgi:deltex-like protein
MGNMPNGTMKAKIDKYTKCAGFPKDQTIVITYSFNDGYIDGHRYTGTYRTAYLPYNEEGIITLGMLKVAFDRKLTFVVGTSVTTGQKNTVVWNGIHHKTSTTGGTSNYGYPDKTYFNRVQEELASKGITKDDFKNGELESIANELIHKY